MKPKEINLVLEGGGVKGIGLVGALTVLEEEGYEFKRVGGTSAGAIVAGLLAVGYTAKELASMMQEVPYKKFRDESLIDRFGPPGKLASLLLDKGIYEGDFFTQWYSELLAEKGIRTFADLKNRHLIICTSDISAGRLLKLPSDYTKLGLVPDDQLVAHAVRASISIPFYFEPVMLAGRYLVDGGLISDFPIDLFDDTKELTFGIRLSAKPDANQVRHQVRGVLTYAEAVFNTMANALDQMHLDNPKVIARTIFVDTAKIQSINFDITQAEQEFLYAAGRKGAGKFLKEFDLATFEKEFI